MLHISGGFSVCTLNILSLVLAVTYPLPSPIPSTLTYLSLLKDGRSKVHIMSSYNLPVILPSSANLIYWLDVDIAVRLDHLNFQN
jgi:hypothetical protein